MNNNSCMVLGSTHPYAIHAFQKVRSYSVWGTSNMIDAPIGEKQDYEEQECVFCGKKQTCLVTPEGVKPQYESSKILLTEHDKVS